MTAKRNFKVLAAYVLAAAQICSAAAGNSPRPRAHHPARAVHPASLKITRPARVPRWNPNRPAGTVDLDQESYAAFVVDSSGQPQLIAKSETIDIDAPRALASHMKLISASVALDAMRADPALKTPENLQRLRRGLLESSNRDIDALMLAVVPDSTPEGVVAALKKKGEELNLSPYFDPENASGDPTPLTKGGARQDSYGTIADVIKIAVNLFGNNDNQQILAAAVYSGISPADRATNYFFWIPNIHQPDWNALHGFLVTKTATANGAGYRTMLSMYDNGEKQYYLFHPNPYGNSYAPSSTSASIFDQVLHQAGVLIDPKMADWFRTIEQKKFPTVKAAIGELQQRSRVAMQQTMARLEPPPAPSSRAKSHYSKARERTLATAGAIKARNP